MVGLKPAITALELGLDFMVVDNGANFSLVRSISPSDILIMFFYDCTT